MFQNISKSFKFIFVTFTIIVPLLPMSIGQAEEINQQVSKSWDSSDLKINRLKYTYTINNFKYCCLHFNNEFVYSPTFSSDNGCNWRLAIFGNGYGLETKEYLSLYIHSVNCHAKASVKFSIVNSNGNQSFTKELEFFEYEPSINVSSNLGFPYFLPHKDLVDEKNGLLPDDKLTIICEIAVLLGRENYSGKLLSSKNLLMEDLAVLLGNHGLSDVTLIAADGRMFKAHKAILAARSLVFRAMFMNDALNRTIDLVKISELDYKSMFEMLRYIYTDKVLGINELAPSLLVAGENYKLDGLKTMCENILRTNLNTENVVDLLILGDKYQAKDLKMDAKYFIATHPLEIKNTTLESLILSKPHLAVEILG